MPFLLLSLKIKNELPVGVALYKYMEGGTTKLGDVRSSESYSLPMSVYVDKTPLKIGIG